MKAKSLPPAKAMVFVARIRCQLGWTQKQLAEELGVHQASVHRWETGTRAMRAGYVKLLRYTAEQNGVAA